MKLCKTITTAGYCLLAAANLVVAADETSVTFEATDRGRLRISVDNQPFAVFVWEDADIPRPYFAALHAPGNVQVTRNYPPDPDSDIADHPTFHPGLWMSFGDLNGSDFWRNKAVVRCKSSGVQAFSTDEGGGFLGTFQYLDEEEKDAVICEEQLRCEIQRLPTGTLLLWNSTFSSDKPFYFGDQEEMGLGVRMATWLRAESRSRGDILPGKGEIVDSEGRINGEQVWGKTSPWCDYRGNRNGKTYGITLFCHPKNFRPSWFHARDYGLLVANPFGRKAFGHGESSRVEVEVGQGLQLRYGVFVHGSDAEDTVELNAVYAKYVKLANAVSARENN